MGVVNVTPDSFSDGGRYLDHDAAIAHGHRVVAEGADWVDVGGESTRPRAEPVPVDGELERKSGGYGKNVNFGGRGVDQAKRGGLSGEELNDVSGCDFS